MHPDIKFLAKAGGPKRQTPVLTLTVGSLYHLFCTRRNSSVSDAREFNHRDPDRQPFGHIDMAATE